jgi:BASS family bile acid:Na+ symporter
MTIETIFNLVVVIFTVANLGAMGLELNVRDAMKALRNAKFVMLIVVWSWVVGPALAYLLTRVLPLAEPYAMGLLLACAAPCAPFYPMVVRKARGDVAFAAALLLLTAVGTVLLMPLLLPLMIKGLTVSASAIAKPLLTLVLTPLVVGIAIRVYAAKAADKLFPVVKKIAGLFTLLTLILVVALYGKKMLDSMGSFAIGAQLLFLGGMALLSYLVGFGLKQNQRSIIGLGMGTRNIAAVFAVLMAIPNPDPRLVVMVILVVPLSVIVALVAAQVFAARAGQPPSEKSEQVNLTFDGPKSPQIEHPSTTMSKRI